MRALQVMRSLLCGINRHAPLRRRAHWDGLNFVTTCKVCGGRLRRREDGRWLREWMEAQERRPAGRKRD